MEPGMTSVRRIRTFADDVRRAKGKETVSPPLESKKELPKKIAPVAVAVRAVPHIPIPAPQAKPTTVDTDSRSLDSAETSIISDKKIQRWSLTDELLISLRGWFNKTFSREDAEKNVARVIPGAQRADIIRAASTENHTAPLGDHKELIGKLQGVIAARKPTHTNTYPELKAVTAQWSTQTSDTDTKPADEPQMSIKRGRPHIMATMTPPTTPELQTKSADELAELAPTSTTLVTSQKEEIPPEPKEELDAYIPPPPVLYTPPIMESEVPPPLPQPEREEVSSIPQPEDEVPTTSSVEDALLNLRQATATIEESSPVFSRKEEIPPEQKEELDAYIPPPPVLYTPPIVESTVSLTSPPEQENASVTPPQSEDEVPTTSSVEDALLNLRQATATIEESFTEKATERARERIAYEQQSEKPPSKLIFYIGMAIVCVFGIFALYLIGTVSYTYFTKTNTVAPEPLGSDRVPLLFAVSQSDPVTLLGDKRSLLNELTRRVREATGTPNGFVHFYLTSPNDSTQTALPAQAFIDAVGIQAPGAFLRTIDKTMMFGAYLESTHAPFIVFKVKNIEDAYGGMLAWEPFINSDLEPLFGENIAFLGYANRRFTDEEVDGKDIRIQTTVDGDIVVLYSFIDPHTLIITNSREALGALREALQ